MDSSVLTAVNAAEASAMVRAAVVLDRVSHDYLVKFDAEQAIEFLFAARSINNAMGNDLAAMVGEINRLIPPMDFGPGNPNNGGAHHEFKIGAEGSRVVYLHILKTYLPDWTKRDYAKLTASLARLGARHEADEAWPTANDDAEYVFRFWWD